MAETVLDRIVTLHDEFVDVPDVPPLCESFGGERKRVDIGGCELYCEIEGDGPPLVLLHGGPGATHHGFHPAFSRAAEFATVVYYDQRGCGESDYEPGDGYSLKQAADDLDALRAALGFEQWFVLGHSYGGLLAQYYATRYPDRLSGLIPVCSSVPVRTAFFPSRAGAFVTEEEANAVRKAHSELSGPAAVYNAMRNGDWKRQHFTKPSDEDFARMALYGWKQDADFRRALCNELSSLHLGGAFDDFPVPTLVLESAQDLTWNEEKPAAVQHLHPRARMIVLDGAGHEPFDDVPDAFFGELRGFLSAAAAEEFDVEPWRASLEEWRERQKRHPAVIMQAIEQGTSEFASIDEAYSPEWLDIMDRMSALRCGMALYDVKRYEDALTVFAAGAKDDGPGMAKESFAATTRIWQGHMLDLLGRRDEAVAVYKEVVESGFNGGIIHSQYGMQYRCVDYAKERMETPFTRIERQDD